MNWPLIGAGYAVRLGFGLTGFRNVSGLDGFSIEGLG